MYVYLPSTVIQALITHSSGSVFLSEIYKEAACLFSCCEGGGCYVRLCDVGATEGELTHFILAITSLIWTVCRGEWRSGGEGDYVAYIRTEERQEEVNVSLFRFKCKMKHARVRLVNKLASLRCVLSGLTALMVQFDPVNMCLWKTRL